MFYCDDCRIDRDWPRSMSVSRGACEVCGETRTCFDLPSSALPKPETHYPECEKLGKVHDEIVVITDFVEWLTSKGITLASIPECYEVTLVPIGTPIGNLVEKFFEIDHNKVEVERRQMLASLRGATT